MKARLSPRFQAPKYCRSCNVQLSATRKLIGTHLCKSCDAARLLDIGLQADRKKPLYKGSKK